MKTLTGKVRAVRRLYLKLDREIACFQKETGLFCKNGCGECCNKADIDATPLEFLPLALDLYDEGKAESFLEELKSAGSFCHVFRPHAPAAGGMCLAYANRGLICRLFGYAARVNKEGRTDLVTCKHIKEEQQESYAEALEKIRSGKHVPIMSNYYSRLASIDPSLAQFYPINVAMARAIETVMAYYAYRRRRVSPRNK